MGGNLLDICFSPIHMFYMPFMLYLYNRNFGANPSYAIKFQLIDAPSSYSVTIFSI